ncbi:hypothetical protein H5410_046802 [Solanum commersonii]|uniref:Uncharacterized protein n=1 Tax=Solanum commersonii TaxID=4109 RepID=A0A9J5XHE9_SOLCO|nr:hypothetical protein H5410_046802 [Solanum commersonii]
MTSFLRAKVVNWPKLAKLREVRVSRRNGSYGPSFNLSFGCFDFVFGGCEVEFKKLPKALDHRPLSAPLNPFCMVNFGELILAPNDVDDSPKVFPIADMPNFFENFEPIASVILI